MKTLQYILILAFASVLLSCQKDPMEDITSGNWNKERNIISLTLQNQIGPATIVRDAQQQKVTVFVDPDGLDFSAVKISAMELSYKAKANVDVNGTLNFQNADYKSQITIKSETGQDLVWDVVLKPYDWFYVKTWGIKEERIFVSQEYGSKFDKAITDVTPDASKEMDNSIQIIKDGVRNGKPYGRIINSAGTDAAYGSFSKSSVNLNPKLRILIPAGESTWEMDLSTNTMAIFKDGVTTNALVTKESFGIRLNYALPQTDRWNCRWDYGDYDNFWCWSYKYYIDLK